MIKILVVDDHKIFRQGIVSLLRSEEGMEVVAEAGTGEAAVKLAQNLNPHIIIMDISLPDLDGIAAAKKIKSAGVNSSIILLTMHKGEEFIEMAAGTGAKGYLLKDDAFDDLLYAIKAVSRGEKFISSSLSTQSLPEPKTPSLPSPLTNREKEIVTLIAEGLSSREISEKLCISIKTVEAHRTNIMGKLNLNNLAELVRYSIKAGLASL